MNHIQSISEVQQAIKYQLDNNVFFVRHNVNILIENSKDIEYEIKNAMGSLGICATISTPSLQYAGDISHTEPFWNITGGQVVVVENPVLNRGRADYATALDTALQIAETLNLVHNICVNNITQTTQGGLVVVTVSFKSNVGFRFIKETETNNG